MTAPEAATSEVAVVLPADLHARPAGQLSQAANRFTSTIEISFGDKTISPRGVLAVMGLGATKGSLITVRATGSDAAAATSALAEVLAAAV